MRRHLAGVGIAIVTQLALAAPAFAQEMRDADVYARVDGSGPQPRFTG